MDASPHQLIMAYSFRMVGVRATLSLQCEKVKYTRTILSKTRQGIHSPLTSSETTASGKKKKKTPRKCSDRWAVAPCGQKMLRDASTSRPLDGRDRTSRFSSASRQSVPYPLYTKTPAISLENPSMQTAAMGGHMDIISWTKGRLHISMETPVHTKTQPAAMRGNVNTISWAKGCAPRLTLSVSSTTTTSSSSTGSPGFFIQLMTVPSLIESPMLGTGTIVTLPEKGRKQRQRRNRRRRRQRWQRCRSKKK